MSTTKTPCAYCGERAIGHMDGVPVCRHKGCRNARMQARQAKRTVMLATLMQYAERVPMKRARAWLCLQPRTE